MNRFWSFLIILAVIVGTGLVLAMRDPFAGAAKSEAKIDIPLPVIPPSRVEAPSPPSWFELKSGEDLSFVLAGTVPSEEIKSAFLASAKNSAPELVVVQENIVVDPTVTSPPWLDPLPDLLGTLVSGVQEPELQIGRVPTRIGGVSGDLAGLAAIRNRFEAIVTDPASYENRLRHDETRPTPETRMPLVLYLGPLEGKYSFEGSLPTAERLKTVRDAVIAAVGEERFSDHLHVSPDTVDEAWLHRLSDLIRDLLDDGNGAMELIVVDRTVTLKGEVPDEASKKKLLDHLVPASEAGYAILDEIRVKK